MVDCLGWAPLEVLVMLTFMGLLHQTSCVNNNIGKRVLCGSVSSVFRPLAVSASGTTFQPFRPSYSPSLQLFPSHPT